MITVVDGVTGRCAYCGGRCSTYWVGGDFYTCAHDGRCVDGIAARCPALTRRTTAVVADDAPTMRRGAYGRRGGVQVAATFVPSRFRGYTHHLAWHAVAETNIGQVSVPCGGNAGHGVEVVSRWELLSVGGRPVTNDSAMAIGAALFDPEGEAVMAWGFQPEIGNPAWEPLDRVERWRLCSGCGAYLWPGRWSTRVGACVLCVGTEDGRVWPREPDFPGEGSIPDHMRDDVPKGRKRRIPKEFKRGEHD